LRVRALAGELGNGRPRPHQGSRDPGERRDARPPVVESCVRSVAILVELQADRLAAPGYYTSGPRIRDARGCAWSRAGGRRRFGSSEWRSFRLVRFGPEIWTMTSWIWPWGRADPNRFQRVILRSSRCSRRWPIRFFPVVKRNLSSAGQTEWVSSLNCRSFVGRTVVNATLPDTAARWCGSR